MGRAQRHLRRPQAHRHVCAGLRRRPGRHAPLVRGLRHQSRAALCRAPNARRPATRRPGPRTAQRRSPPLAGHAAVAAGGGAGTGPGPPPPAGGAWGGAPGRAAGGGAPGAPPQLRVTVRGRTPVTLWAPDGGRRLAVVERAGAGIAARMSTQGLHDAVDARRSLSVRYSATLGLATAQLDGGRPTLSLPPLTSWRFSQESPEIAPAFDDRDWRRAAQAATSNPNVPARDTLLADDYGFHYGFVWYRGTFRGTGAERAVRLYARNSYIVWLNGRYLGSSTVHNDLKNVDDQLSLASSQPRNATYADGLSFPIRRGQIKVGATNTLAVLTESLGPNAGFANGERTRSPMGLLPARLPGPARPPAIQWKIQGAAQPYDGVDSPLNASGLYSER